MMSLHARERWYAVSRENHLKSYCKKKEFEKSKQKPKTQTMVYHRWGAFIRIAAPQYVVGLLEWASGLELVVEEGGRRNESGRRLGAECHSKST
jgi:hypothetical protein